VTEYVPAWATAHILHALISAFVVWVQMEKHIAEKKKLLDPEIKKLADIRSAAEAATYVQHYCE